MDFSPDTLFYVFTVIVPGFMVDAVLSSVVPRRPAALEVTLLRYVAFTALSYTISSPLVYALVIGGLGGANIWVVALCWFVVIFVVPVVVGGILGMVVQKDLLRRAVQRVGLQPMHPVPTAWDWKLGTVEAQWVTVTLVDGSSVTGLFGCKSCASSDPAERDLYLEETVAKDAEGNTKEGDGNEGILIKGDQIKYVEFLAESEGGQDGTGNWTAAKSENAG